MNEFVDHGEQAKPRERLPGFIRELSHGRSHGRRESRPRKRALDQNVDVLLSRDPDVGWPRHHPRRVRPILRAQSPNCPQNPKRVETPTKLAPEAYLLPLELPRKPLSLWAKSSRTQAKSTQLNLTQACWIGVSSRFPIRVQAWPACSWDFLAGFRARVGIGQISPPLRVKYPRFYWRFKQYLLNRIISTFTRLVSVLVSAQSMQISFGKSHGCAVTSTNVRKSGLPPI